MILDLVKQNDPILRQPTLPFNFQESGQDARRLAEDLADTMIHHRGVGIAAPQCGIPYSVFVIGDPKNKESIMAFFNPKIVDFFGEEVYYNEGCFSFPKLFIKIKRYSQIKMRFTDIKNETTTVKYTGFTARAIQHEYDHLSGILFTTKANHYHLSKAKKDQKLLARRSKNSVR